MNRAFLCLLLSCLLTVACVNVKTPKQTSGEGAPRWQNEPLVHTTVGEVFATYNSDVERGDLLFKGKRLEITGMVVAVPRESTTVQLGDVEREQMGALFCTFSGMYKSEVDQLEERQIVTFHGIGDGRRVQNSWGIKDLIEVYLCSIAKIHADKESWRAYRAAVQASMPAMDPAEVPVALVAAFASGATPSAEMTVDEYAAWCTGTMRATRPLFDWHPASWSDLWRKWKEIVPPPELEAYHSAMLAFLDKRRTDGPVDVVEQARQHMIEERKKLGTAARDALLRTGCISE